MSDHAQEQAVEAMAKCAAVYMQHEPESWRQHEGMVIAMLKVAHAAGWSPPRAAVGGEREAPEIEMREYLDSWSAWKRTQGGEPQNITYLRIAVDLLDAERAKVAAERAAGFREGVEACWKHLADGGFVVALVRAEKEIRALAAAKGEVA